MAKTTPTLDDIFDLAHQVGVPLPEWIRQEGDWATVLHELSHWAVKPAGYVQVYLEKIKPYSSFLPINSIPNTETVMCFERRPTVRWPNGQQWQLPLDHVLVHGLDPTPNEFGARAWGLQVLDWMNWRNPLECEEMQEKYAHGVGTAEFSATLLTSDDPHVISRYGPDQIAFMGIDVARGILRPQVEVTFDGQWIRVWRNETVIWEVDVLDGGEVIAWESLDQPERFLTIADIEALCGAL